MFPSPACRLLTSFGFLFLNVRYILQVDSSTRIRNLPKVLNSNPAHSGSDLPVRRWGHLISIEKGFVCQLCTPDVLTSLPQSCRSSAREIFHQSAACSFTSASSCQSLPDRVTDSEILDRSMPCDEPTCGIWAHVQIRLYTIQTIFCLLSVCMHWHFAKVRLIPDECGWSRRSCLHAAAFCKLGLFEDHLQNETLENVQQTPILSW